MTEHKVKFLPSGRTFSFKTERLYRRRHERQVCLSGIKSDLVIRIPQESVLDTGVLDTAVAFREETFQDTRGQNIQAGAFGSYIDLDCAMTVGLLPDVAPEMVE